MIPKEMQIKAIKNLKEKTKEDLIKIVEELGSNKLSEKELNKIQQTEIYAVIKNGKVVYVTLDMLDADFYAGAINRKGGQAMVYYGKLN